MLACYWLFILLQNCHNSKKKRIHISTEKFVCLPPVPRPCFSLSGRARGRCWRRRQRFFTIQNGFLLLKTKWLPLRNGPHLEVVQSEHAISGAGEGCTAAPQCVDVAGREYRSTTFVCEKRKKPAKETKFTFKQQNVVGNTLKCMSQIPALKESRRVAVWVLGKK